MFYSSIHHLMDIWIFADYCEYCCCEYCEHVIAWTYVFIFEGYIPRNKIAGLYGYSVIAI